MSMAFVYICILAQSTNCSLLFNLFGSFSLCLSKIIIIDCEKINLFFSEFFNNRFSKIVSLYDRSNLLDSKKTLHPKFKKKKD